MSLLAGICGSPVEKKAFGLICLADKEEVGLSK